MAELTADERTGIEIESVRLIVGLEIHVELSTRTKMFTAAPSPACAESESAGPNRLTDPVVLALPGALPVMNKAAVEMSVLVGLALGCSIAEFTKWDRKCYTYPDLPKGYQISQYDLPLCFDGLVDLPEVDADGNTDWAGPTKPIGIVRAHLEEDAGKLLHEAPGGGALDHSIVDLNRAGTPLLEIVTQPDFGTADDVVAFCRLLRQTCRFLGITEGVMQKGHMRFEPNINCELTLAGGRTVRTPVVEVKNLNSFRAVKGAIEYEFAQQPGRWREDGREMGRGMKTTRGWDDSRSATTPQREKEDAHDYRYFPDPDLLPVRVDEAWRQEIASGLPELPAARARRYTAELALTGDEATTLVEERCDAELFDGALAAAVALGLSDTTAARAVANILLQHGARIANERSEGTAAVRMGELGLGAEQLGQIAALRDADKISSANAGKLFEKLCDPEYAGKDAEAVAEYEGWMVVRDEGQLDTWCDEVLADNGAIAEQIKGGKVQAVGRLIGEVMKKSGGSADAKSVRERLLARLGVEG